jgi:hypothetical protein
MKSGRQRRAEILEQRRHRARIAERMSVEPWREPDRVPAGAISAEQAKLLHDRTLGPRPRFYMDRRFTCVECGTEEVWTAADQKWWYEEAKGKIATRANRCSTCRTTMPRRYSGPVTRSSSRCRSRTIRSSPFASSAPSAGGTCPRWSRHSFLGAAFAARRRTGPDESQRTIKREGVVKPKERNADERGGAVKRSAKTGGGTGTPPENHWTSGFRLLSTSRISLLWSRARLTAPGCANTASIEDSLACSR